MYSKNKQVEYDIQSFLKNPKDLKEVDKRNFISKYFIILFLPIILSLILFVLLLLVHFEDYLSVQFLLPILYVLFLYFCLVEYFSFVRIFKEYPEFAYVYFLAKTDKTKKKDFAYDKAVQKLYNQLNKRKNIAKKRLKYKFLFGIPTFSFVLLTVLFGQPSASPMVIAVAIILILYLLIDMIMSFGGKKD